MSSKTLIKNGCVLTFDKRIGNYTKADILIEGSKIKAIHPQIEVPDAHLVDATNMIVIPGFIDGHRHTWEAAIREIATDFTFYDYEQVVLRGLRNVYRPHDVFVGNFLGALEALNSGVTSLLDWCHNTPTFAHAEAGIMGLKHAGIRGSFYYNVQDNLSMNETRHILCGLLERYFTHSDDLLHLGVALTGPEGTPMELLTQQMHMCRELGLPISIHVGDIPNIKSVKKMYKAGLLGPDVNLVHCTNLEEEEYKYVADSGVTVAISPASEMQMIGIPVTGKLLNVGVKPSLGVDSVTAMAGDMFMQVRLVLQLERMFYLQGQWDSGVDTPKILGMSSQQALDLATIEGARVLGIDQKVGTLTPGKDADLTLVRYTDLNLFPMNNPVGAMALCAETMNVDSVFVSGRAIKRHGQLVHVNMDQVLQMARESRDYIFTMRGVPYGSKPL
ncbi:amidohydrolase family protein [Paenibacillus sp. N1-5-1-14]|uniref:amidohydrolase family protein n=1 Tax=Paenibacillus radicibacter TaxID=2972488 RepID=UPI0021591080|nr:amidohydrolase family protein [Paenibacillus radicibacter]MCR8643614.1 amidohydrolase family protein [Paenibacillus radicibacter]